MVSFRRFVALLLLTLWLPATQHCALMAAGLVQSTEVQDGSSCGCPSGTPCGKEDCRNLELSTTGAIPENFAVVVPEAALCTCLICPNCLARGSISEFAILPMYSAEPVELTRTWQFLRRAAPSPRPPGLA